MKIFYADHYVLPLPAQHRFPMSKYALLRARVEEERLAGVDGLESAPRATDEEILRAHDARYLARVTGWTTEQRRATSYRLPLVA